MLAPKKTHEVPIPDGWKYVCPDTGIILKSSVFDNLEKMIRVHKENNHLEYDHNEVIQNLVKNTGSVWFEDTDDVLEVGIQDLLRFVVNISSWIYRGAKMCDEEVAKERFKTCQVCKESQREGTGEDNACSTCPKPTKLMLMAMGGKELTKLPTIHCRKCKCLMNVRVYFNGIKEDTSKYPSCCWKIFT